MTLAPLMIPAPIRDQYLLQAVRRASFAVEDVFAEAEDILGALRVGSPRIAILDPESDELVVRIIRRVGPKLPILEVAPPRFEHPTILGDVRRHSADRR